MKVRVLYPQAFRHLEPPPLGGDIVDLPDGQAFLDAGYAEPVTPGAKVERATKAPGEKRDVIRPKAKG